MTVRVVVPVTVPDVAEMIDVPCPSELARPEVFIEETPGLAEDQTTELVRSLVPPSLNVPIAVICCVNPSARDGLAGVILIAVKLAGGAVADDPPPPQAVNAARRKMTTRMTSQR